MKPEEIKNLIEIGLPKTQAVIEGDGTHFNAIVISPAFYGKSRLQKQQLVYDTVREKLLDGTLHALSIKTYTPEEWQSYSLTGPKDSENGKVNY